MLRHHHGQDDCPLTLAHPEAEPSDAAVEALARLLLAAIADEEQGDDTS